MLKRAARGLTLVELIVAIALTSILLALAVPQFGLWTRNAKVRSVADSLITGVRLAQTEAVRRNRQMVLFLTNSESCTSSITASADGAYWALRTVPLMNGESAQTLQCGMLADTAAGVSVAGPAALCVNSMGRQVANANPGVGGSACTLDASGTTTYTISIAEGDRPLRVLVGLGGHARLCDPARTLSSSQPDGCPA